MWKSFTFRVMYTDKYKEYKVAVVDSYLLKKEHAMEDWLINPTLAKVKKICLELTEPGLAKHDEKTLRNYLEISPGVDHLRILKKADLEDFKGFVSFLKKTDVNPAETSVELLAWLIDFPDRPYSRFIGITPDITTATRVDEENTVGLNDGAVPTEEEKPGKGVTVMSPNRNYRWLMIVIVLTLIGTLWFFWPQNEGCMYWSNDRYIAASCSVPKLDTPLVAIDRAKLRGFRRIGRVDTLTAYAVNRFWYTRVADSIEVYTAEGRHPVYADKTLKKVTDYVVNFCRNRGNRNK